MIDKIDKSIIGYLIRDGPSTASDLVAKIFEPKSKTERHRCYMQLSYRLGCMVDSFMLTRDPVSKKYSLYNSTISDESTLILHTNDGDISIKTGPTICFYLPGEYNRIEFLDQ